MTFSDAVRTCLREKYVTFSGRAPRSEYWWFILFTYLVMIVLTIILAAVTGGFASFQNPDGPGAAAILIMIVFGIFALGIILPSIAVTVRRFHDYNLSGWWYLGAIVAGFIPFVGFLASIAAFVITVLKGTDGPNNFGPDPLRTSDADVFN